MKAYPSCLVKRALAATAFLVCVSSAELLFAGQFQIDDFSTAAASNLVSVNGNAAVSGSDLRLTSSSLRQTGTAFTNNLYDVSSQFSTYFSFKMTDPNATAGDGFAFAIQNSSAQAVGGHGGYFGVTNSGHFNNSLSIEFDTFDNGGSWDINDNHVGINVNGSPYSVQSVNPGFDLNDGTEYHAWIDYDGTDLSVFLSDDINNQGGPLLTYAVDIQNMLGSTDAYLGFGAGTYSATQNHDITAWAFSSGASPAPEPSTGVLLCLSLLSMLRMRRSQRPV